MKQQQQKTPKKPCLYQYLQFYFSTIGYIPYFIFSTFVIPSGYKLSPGHRASCLASNLSQICRPTARTQNGWCLSAGCIGWKHDPDRKKVDGSLEISAVGLLGHFWTSLSGTCQLEAGFWESFLSVCQSLQFTGNI